MKTKLYFATCLLIAAGLVSCQKQEFAMDEYSMLNYVEDLRIEKNNRNLTPEEAVNVARLYAGANAAVKPVTTKSAGDIYTIRDYDGEPVAYAVNNAGGEGFIMQKLSGQGTAFVEIDGSVVEYQLAPGQSMLLDTGYLSRRYNRTRCLPGWRHNPPENPPLRTIPVRLRQAGQQLQAQMLITFS